MSLSNVASLPLSYYEKLRREDNSPDTAFAAMRTKFPNFREMPPEIVLIDEWRTILAQIYDCFVKNILYRPTSSTAEKLCDLMIAKGHLLVAGNGFVLTAHGRDFARGSWERLIEEVPPPAKPSSTLGEWLVLGLLGLASFCLTR